ncbi:MAG: exo-alpha-sialidase [Clostridia bacterium]|nr:exo-alpha-sialidase [Clostridia bacterium]
MLITVYKHEGKYNHKTCYVHARGAHLPDGHLLITTQKLNVSGCDDFEGLEVMEAYDGGARITSPKPDEAFGRKMLSEGIFHAQCDATPMYHKASGKIIVIGHDAYYSTAGTHVRGVENRGFYSVYDDENKHFLPVSPFQVSISDTHLHTAPGSVQFYEDDEGLLWIPFTIKKHGSPFYEVVVFSFVFDGEKLCEVGRSNILSYPIARGAYEPSLIYAGGKFLLTVRNDTVGLFSTSTDGKHFEELAPWRFDDGEVLPNYNTQQHFLALGDAVYLVYTRRGANNDHVFRHRAPLFLAQIDTDRMHLIRASERVVVPERGARLGNFGVTNVSRDLAYLTVTEWMQPVGCEKYGSDNALFIVKFENQ